MAIRESRTARALTLFVEGPLNFANAEVLKEKIQAGMSEGLVRFIVDMEKTPLVDSTGVGILVSMHNRLADSGGAIRLSAVQDNVMRILKAAHLDSYIEIFSNVTEAALNFS